MATEVERIEDFVFHFAGQPQSEWPEWAQEYSSGEHTTCWFIRRAGRYSGNDMANHHWLALKILTALTSAEQVRAMKADDLSGLVENIDARIQAKTECKIGADEWLKISNALCAELVRESEPDKFRAVYDAAKDFADYHNDFEIADLEAISLGTAKDDYHTDKTARIILAVRAVD